MFTIDELNTLTSALVWYRDSMTKSASNLGDHNEGMKNACYRDAAKAIVLINKMHALQVPVDPIQYWAIVTKNKDDVYRVIAPFCSEKEAGDYYREHRYTEFKECLNTQIICTENAVPQL